MLRLTAIPLALLLSACWTPGPGEVDPTRYPWNQRKLDRTLLPIPHPSLVARGKIARNPSSDAAPQRVAPESSYCIMAIEQEAKSGIVLGGNANVMACTAPPNNVPK